MASQTDWANRALDKIGENPIINLDDSSSMSKRLSRIFPIVRDAEMRKRKWSFTIKRAMLAADVGTPLYGYGAQFTLPIDCLRVLSIFAFDIGPNLSDYSAGMSQTYVIEGRKILYGRPMPGGPAPTEPMPLRYIAQTPDTTLWDPCFGEAFACKLAAEIAEKVTQSSEKRQLALAEYAMAINEAKRANAIELPADYITDDTWLVGRLRG